MIKLPFPSFIDRPLPYLLWYLLAVVVLCLWPFNFLQTNQVTWEPGGGLRFTPPATAYTPVSPTKLSGLQQWTILLEVKPLPPLRLSRILAYSLDEERCNLNLDQMGDDIVLRVRTGSNKRPREFRVEKVFEQGVERRYLLAFVYDGRILSIYADGERRLRERIGAIDYTSWGSQYPLVLGSNANGAFGWLGVVYGLEVFPHAVNPAALKNGWNQFIPGSPVLFYRFTEANGTTVIDHSPKNPVPISWPEKFAPYKRTVLQSALDYWPELRRLYMWDMLANVILYIPLGYLLSTLVRHRLSGALAAIAPVMIAIGVSLAIEILQAYLPSRNSSQMDVIMNCLGACIGVLISHAAVAEKVLTALNVSFREAPVLNTFTVPKTL